MTKYRLVKWWEKVGENDQYSYCEDKCPDLDGGGWPSVEGRSNGAVGNMYGLPLFIAKLRFRWLYHKKSEPPYIRRKR